MEVSGPNPWYKTKQLFLLLGVVFLAAALVIWLVPFGSSDREKAEKVTTAFVEAVAAGDKELTGDLEKSGEFYTDPFINRVIIGIENGVYQTLLRGYESITFSDAEFGSTGIRPEVLLTGLVNFVDRPSIKLTASLIKANGSWKLDGLGIGGN